MFTCGVPYFNARSRVAGGAIEEAKAVAVVLEAAPVVLRVLHVDGLVALDTGDALLGIGDRVGALLSLGSDGTSVSPGKTSTVHRCRCGGRLWMAHIIYDHNYDHISGQRNTW